MDTRNHIFSGFTISTDFAAALRAIVYIAVISFVKDPDQQKINTFLIAGERRACRNDGLGVWEFIFGPLMLFAAFKELKRSSLIPAGYRSFLEHRQSRAYTEHKK